jgi:MFS family permease
VGEYSSFIIVLAFLSDKFTVTFGQGIFGYVFVGLISGVFLISSGVVAIYMGHLSDKYGRRKMMIIGCLLGAAALLSLVVADNLTQLAPFAVATAISITGLGLAHGTYTASTLAYGGDLAEKHTMMGKAYGLVDGAEFAGYAFGPALGTTVAYLSSRTGVFEMATLMLLISGGLAVVFMPEIRPTFKAGAPEHHDDEVEGAFHEMEESHIEFHTHSASWGDYVNAFRMPIVGVALLTTLVGAVAFSAFFSFVPLYAYSLRGVVPPFALFWGYLASIMAVTGVLFMVPFGHFEDKTNRRMPYLVAGLIGAAASLSIVFFFPATLPSFVIAAVAFGLAIGVVRVSQLVILAEASHPSNRAAIMGTNHALEHVGYGLAAVSVGALVGFLKSFVLTFQVLSLVLIVAGLAFLLYARRAKVK